VRFIVMRDFGGYRLRREDGWISQALFATCAKAEQAARYAASDADYQSPPLRDPVQDAA